MKFPFLDVYSRFVSSGWCLDHFRYERQKESTKHPVQKVQPYICMYKVIRNATRIESLRSVLSPCSLECSENRSLTIFIFFFFFSFFFSFFLFFLHEMADLEFQKVFYLKEFKQQGVYINTYENVLVFVEFLPIYIYTCIYYIY